MPTTHELKCWPSYFAAIRSGSKSFEIRRNDREFAVGDTIVLREFSPADASYTGQAETRLITFLLSEEEFGVVHGFVVIGFGALPRADDIAPANGLTRDQLVDWHEIAANSAALRAEAARRVSKGYQRLNMGVAAEKHAAVAEFGETEASFHAAAAAIVRADARAEAA